MSSPVVVLIFTHKPEPDKWETISLRQCAAVLGRHPLRLVCPDKMEVGAYLRLAPGLEVDYLPARWFSSVDAYNRLKLSPYLYRRYAEFDYMLTYELDAFVFRDELPDWCGRGWDYIGAPWFEDFVAAKPDAPYLGVGNSGFSLRRIATMLRIATTWKRIASTPDLWKLACASRRHPARKVQKFAQLLLSNNFHYPFCPSDNEDRHWGLRVPKAFPGFRVAPIAEARRFSFEYNPARLFRESGEQLPFGCHKWTQYDPEFWFPRIRACGYDV